MNNPVELQALDKKNHVQMSASTKFLDGDTNAPRQKAKWTKLLLISGIASTIGTTVPGKLLITIFLEHSQTASLKTAGYAIGVVNSPAEYMRKWANESLIKRYEVYLSVNALDVLWSTIVSMFIVGGAIGSLSGAWTADKFGRKFSLLVSKVLFIVAALCFLSCRQLNSVELLLLGRLLVGLASGLCISCLPMYLSEIAPLDLRGTLSVFCALGLCGGTTIAQIFSLRSVLGSESHWHIALSFYVFLNLVALVGYKWFPESPKWLFVVKKDIMAAKFELQRLRYPDESALIAEELENMKVESQESSQAMGFKEVLTGRKFSLPLLLVFIYQAGQQLSGINAIFYYSVSIFQRAGLTSAAAEWANLGAGSLNFAISLSGPYLMAKFNRRPLMLFSTFCCFIALLTFALMLYFIEIVSWFAIGCVTCLFCYIFFYQLGVGPIPYFIASELFEVYPCPVAMSFGSLANFSGNFLVGMTFPSLQNAWGSLVFLPFAIMCAIMFALTYFYLPETRGRTPTEVADIVSRGFKSKVRNVERYK